MKLCPREGFREPPLIEYHDSFLGRRRRIGFQECDEIDSPLHLIDAAARRLHLTRGYPLEKTEKNASAYMRMTVARESCKNLESYVPGYELKMVELRWKGLWPVQLQRVAFGFTLRASHGLATAHLSLNVSASTTWCWRTRILRRVLGSLVAKIQVHEARHLIAMRA